MNDRKDIIGLTAGFHPFRLCFTAEMTIFSIRSVRKVLRSENLQSRKLSTSKPTSVAFSAIHSMRPMSFVGAMARWIRPLQARVCRKVCRMT